MFAILLLPLICPFLDRSFLGRPYLACPFLARAVSFAPLFIAFIDRTSLITPYLFATSLHLRYRTFLHRSFLDQSLLGRTFHYDASRSSTMWLAHSLVMPTLCLHCVARLGNMPSHSSARRRA